MRLFAIHPPLPFATSYVLGADLGSAAVLIDPGYFDASLLSALERNRLEVVAVLLTHSHPAHAQGLKTVLKVYDAEVFAGQHEVDDCGASCLGDGDRFQAAGLNFQALAVPGHSPDSLVYRTDGVLFSGDALSAGEVGRTSSPQAAAQQERALRSRVAGLPAATLVMPGHGPPTTIAIELAFNPSLTALDAATPEMGLAPAH